MERVPEPELMDQPEQVAAYAQADFTEPNRRFVDLFCRTFAGQQPLTILDLGCGPADITIRLARVFADSRVDGVDGGPNMLECGRAAVSGQGLSNRVRLLEGRLPGVALAEAGYAAVVSNSLLHHLADPQALWEAVRRAGCSGALVLVMDLLRPGSRAAAQALVQQYAEDEPAVLQKDFLNSLLAAYRPAEVRAQLTKAGLSRLEVRQVSDRHLAVWGRLP